MKVGYGENRKPAMPRKESFRYAVCRAKYVFVSTLVVINGLKSLSAKRYNPSIHRTLHDNAAQCR